MEAAPGAIEEIRCGLMAVLMALPLRAPYWSLPYSNLKPLSATMRMVDQQPLPKRQAVADGLRV